MSVLSHYTTRTGLEGISSTGTLRATSFLDVTGDTSEFFFGWNALIAGAKELFLPRVPEDIRPSPDAFDATMARVSGELREQISRTDGVGHLFVTSFARGSTDDHERRGILTLWDRYTRHEGYCLQFDEDHIRRLLQAEARWTNYVALGLAPVTYGIRADASDYQELCFQLAQFFLQQALITSQDGRLAPEYDRMWPFFRLARGLMDFCARHKDPLYEDEREVRIFAYPADYAEGRPFIGIADVKTVHRLEGGRRYICLAEQRQPKFRPNRILVGARADRDVDDIPPRYLGRRDMPPVIERVALPVV